MFSVSCYQLNILNHFAVISGYEEDTRVWQVIYTSLSLLVAISRIFWISCYSGNEEDTMVWQVMYYQFLSGYIQEVYLWQL